MSAHTLYTYSGSLHRLQRLDSQEPSAVQERSMQSAM